ncbi:MAG: heme-copper oxidase subunit III [Flavobacteriales bacterium]|nr:MAG: heme-copper oxidase subunit III [Flavobacteriales bacterium]MBE7441168.1 heme-copper oxidase subunit III [Flavobacteriales bacterium]MCL4856949.1 cytochrome c oxidase subunit 3 [Flavobacteriales bacterium]
MTTITLQDNILSKDEIRKKTAKPLLWIGIVSIVMFFGGWTSAVIVSKGASSNWLNINLPISFTISTIIIILSSLSFHYGLIAIKNNKTSQLKWSVIITLLLGLGFVLSQYLGWKELYQNGVFATGSKSTSASSFIYLITVFHVLHLLAGIISLIIVGSKSFLEKYSSQNTLGVELSVIYWHFLGGLWIYLFLFLKYIA